MIGDTLSLTINGVTVVLDKVNQDNFGSEFLKRTSAAGVTTEHRVRVRHQSETARAGQKVIERHNVELTETCFNADGTDTFSQAYVVIRHPKGRDPAVVENAADGLIAALTPALINKVVGWQS